MINSLFYLVLVDEGLRSNNLLLAGGVSGQPTSFIPYKDEHGHCVLQTPVKILFCDLRLASGECKICKKVEKFSQINYRHN